MGSSRRIVRQSRKNDGTGLHAVPPAYETALARFLGLLEPILIVAVGIVVLIVTVSVLGPMLQLARSAAG